MSFFQWNPTTTYNSGAGVSNLSILYVSLQNQNYNKVPASNPLWWRLTSSGGGVTAVSPGTGIGITGTSSNPIINNAGVLDVSSGSGIHLTGTAQDPILTGTYYGGVNGVTVTPDVSGNMLVQASNVASQGVLITTDLSGEQHFTGTYYAGPGVSIAPDVSGNMLVRASNATGSGIAITLSGNQQTFAADLSGGTGIALTGSHPIVISATGVAGVTGIKAGPGIALTPPSITIPPGYVTGNVEITSNIVSGAGVAITTAIDGTLTVSTDLVANFGIQITPDLITDEQVFIAVGGTLGLTHYNILTTDVSGVLAFPDSTQSYMMDFVICGGGGGGSYGKNSAGANCLGGGGGGSGQFTSGRVMVAPNLTVAFTIGHGGAGGSSGSGSDGTNTVLTIGSVTGSNMTITAWAGQGGQDEDNQTGGTGGGGGNSGRNPPLQIVTTFGSYGGGGGGCLGSGTPP